MCIFEAANWKKWSVGSTENQKSRNFLNIVSKILRLKLIQSDHLFDAKAWKTEYFAMEIFPTTLIVFISCQLCISEGEQKRN